MDDTRFWAIIDRARDTADGDAGRQAESVVEQLLRLDAARVTEFARHFEARYHRAYRWDVWGAAWVLCEGVSDDAFDHFRCWLIGRGRRVFEGALREPDALAELLPSFDRETEGEAEELGCAAYEAYERLTGTALPEMGLPEPPEEPSGTPLNLEDDAQLATRFPRLWARFGS